MLSTTVWNSLSEILLRGLPLIYFFQISWYLIIEEISELIPFATLFAGIMVSTKMSQNLEFVSLRACGISMSAVYSRFFIFGLAVAILAFFLNNMIAPLMSRERIRLVGWIGLFQGLSLIKEGTFVSAKGDSNVRKIGFYTGKRDDFRLEEIYVHQVSPVNQGQTADENQRYDLNQILYAKRGIIAQRVTNESTVKENNLTENNKGARPIPSYPQESSFFRPGYSDNLKDISYSAGLGHFSTFQSRQHFLRLFEGYSMLFNWDKNTMIISDFRAGSFDYTLAANDQSSREISNRDSIYTISELRNLIHGIEYGGLLISFYKIEGRYDPPRVAYDEEQPVLESLRELIHRPGYYIMLPNLAAMQELRDESRFTQYTMMSNQEIGDKLNWYVPPEIDSVEKKAYFFNEILRIFTITAADYRSFRLAYHKRLGKVMSILFLTLIALPMGLLNVGYGRAVGTGIATLVYLVYYIGGLIFEKLTLGGYFTVFIGVWLPELLFLLYILYLYQRKLEVGYSFFARLSQSFGRHRLRK